MKNKFNNTIYVMKQTSKILSTARNKYAKTYIRLGSELIDGKSVSDVIDGYNKNNLSEVLSRVGAVAEAIVTINVADIINRDKYCTDLFKNYIYMFRNCDIDVNNVVITDCFDNNVFGEETVRRFINILSEDINVNVIFHTHENKLFDDIENVLCDTGYGLDTHIETNKKIVFVAGVGYSSFDTCMSQMYNDYTRGIESWYCSLDTTDILNNIPEDRYAHIMALSISEEIYGKSIYNSPTDVCISIINKEWMNND